MKEQILQIIKEHCANEVYEKNSAQALSQIVKVSRNEIASVLNDLHSVEKLIKVTTKPILFLDKSSLEDKLGRSLKATYPSLEAVFLEQKDDKEDFDLLIGHDGSLSDLVKQCKATISYPPKGLPMMLHGETGTGKSYIAKLTYDYAKNKGLIKADAKFIAVNCSEYANNPELLTANLFGHTKGAFTGADKANPGLIALADGGVLFLDEVHNLKAECQEKLFLYMDQSIYHQVGDNEKWYQSEVRMIFATTEKPEEVLLKTLQRRIPMTIYVPTLNDRGLQERIQLLYLMFKEEEKKLQKKIKLSAKAYNVLLSYEFLGNIGGLKSCVQSCCVNSLFNESSTHEIIIQLASFPKHMLSSYANKTQAYLESNDFISVDEMYGFIRDDKEIIKLNEGLLQNFTVFQQDKLDKVSFLKNNEIAVRQYFDDILFKERDVAEADFYQNGVQNIFDLAANHYGLKMTNNDLVAISHFLHNYCKDYHSFNNWVKQNGDSCERFITIMKTEYYHEFNIANEIGKYLSSYLDMEVSTMVVLIILILITSVNKSEKRKKIGVILAHGFSTASSIADATNKFLGQYVFDAIDMPLNVDTNTIINKLNGFLNRIGKFDELLLLVDMGSLEDIYKGIEVKNANIGIINNISTKTALAVGNGMMLDKPMEDIFEEAIMYTSTTYHIEKNKQKEDIILCSCASGMGTAEKLRIIIQDSLPVNSAISVRTYNYNELIEKGTNDAFFDDYYVLCVIGTLNPNIDELNFIPIEDLIINDSLNELDHYLDGKMNEEQLSHFKKNILKNFSLSNIMNDLTILNPNKLLEHVADAIDKLQMAMNQKLSNHTCFGLYVHISCMIERLVMQKEIEVYPDMDVFEKKEDKFIKQVRMTFREVEDFYGVEIPIAEIGYIFDYVKNDDR